MKLDYHGDSGMVEPRGNVRIQTRTHAQGILSAIAIFHQPSKSRGDALRWDSFRIAANPGVVASPLNRHLAVGPASGTESHLLVRFSQEDVLNAKLSIQGYRA